MNFKKQAEKLERLLEEEFQGKTPIVVLPDKSLVYKKYKIKQNSQQIYELRHISGDIIETFKLKVTAILAAKFYSTTRFDRFKEIKNLDTGYWTNSIDSVIFKIKLGQTKDNIKKNIFLSRYQLTLHRADNYKQQITRMFRYNFG